MTSVRRSLSHAAIYGNALSCVILKCVDYYVCTLAHWVVAKMIEDLLGVSLLRSLT